MYEIKNIIYLPRINLYICTSLLSKETMNNEGLDEGGGGDNAPEANVIPVAGAIESLDDYVRRNGIRHADENGMYDSSHPMVSCDFLF